MPGHSPPPNSLCYPTLELTLLSIRCLFLCDFQIEGNSKDTVLRKCNAPIHSQEIQQQHHDII